MTDEEFLDKIKFIVPSSLSCSYMESDGLNGVIIEFNMLNGRSSKILLPLDQCKELGKMLYDFSSKIIQESVEQNITLN